MAESDPQPYLLNSLPPEKDTLLEEDAVLQAELKRPLAPHERAHVIKKFRKAGDRQSEILISYMSGYAGTSAVEAVLPSEDSLEAINGPVGGLTPFDQELLLQDQARLDKEFEDCRPKPVKRRASVAEIAKQLSLPDIFQRPVPPGDIQQHRLFSEWELGGLKKLVGKDNSTARKYPDAKRTISRIVRENLGR